MPTYAYQCKDCEHSFDIHQAFTDDSLTTCPECGGALRKKFNSVGVTFKGSGFYSTDSRSSKPQSSTDSSNTKPGTAKESHENHASKSTTDTSSDSKPALTTTPTNSGESSN